MKNLFLVALSGLLLSSGCKSVFPGDANPTCQQFQTPPFVSVLRIIADPAAFSDQELIVVGFLKIENGRGVLFVSEEDAKNYLLVNAIRVTLPTECLQRSSDFNSRYVSLLGLFKSMPDHVNGMTVGRLNNVSRGMTTGVGPVYTFPESVVPDEWNEEWRN